MSQDESSEAMEEVKTEEQPIIRNINLRNLLEELMLRVPRTEFENEEEPEERSSYDLF